MKKTELMYEGKAKRVYATDTDGICIVDYKDDATAFNGAKKGTIVGKGVVNNRMSNRIMRMLEKHDIPTHLIEELSERETAVVRAGSLSKRLGIEEGTKLPSVVLEYCYKNDALDDPMINDSHAIAMGLATKEDLDTISAYALKIDEILIDFFAKLGIELVDFKIEFGKKPDGTIILADEISPDTCRLWDSITHEKLDKDRFRRDMGGVEDAYQEVMRRLTGE